MSESAFMVEEVTRRPPHVRRGDWWCQVEPVGRSGVDLTLSLPVADTRGADYVTRYCHAPDGWAFPCVRSIVAAQQDAPRWMWEPDAWQVGPGSLWVPGAPTLAELYPSTETGLWAEILGTVGTVAGAFVGGAGAPVGGAAGAALGAGLDAATSTPEAPEGSRFSYIFAEDLPTGGVRYARITDPVQRRAIFELATTMARNELATRRDIFADPWAPQNQPTPAELERRRAEILRTYAVVPRRGQSATAAVSQDAATAAAILAAAAGLVGAAARGAQGPSGGPASRIASQANAGTTSGSLTSAILGAAGGANNTSSNNASSNNGASTAARLLALLGGLAGSANTNTNTSSAPVSPQTAATLLSALQQLAGGSGASSSAAGASSTGAADLARLLRGVL